MVGGMRAGETYSRDQDGMPQWEPPHGRVAWTVTGSGVWFRDSGEPIYCVDRFGNRIDDLWAVSDAAPMNSPPPPPPDELHVKGGNALGDPLLILMVVVLWIALVWMLVSQ